MLPTLLLLLAGCMLAQYSLCLSLSINESTRPTPDYIGIDESRCKTKSGSKFLKLLRCHSGFEKVQKQKLYELLLTIKYASSRQVKRLLRQIKPAHRYLNCPIILGPKRESTTMLHVAIEREKTREALKIIQLLILNGATAMEVNGAGETPLHLIVQQPHFELQAAYVHEILENACVDVNALDNQQMTPLQHLPEAGNLEELEANLEIAILFDQAGANFDVVDGKGRKLDIYGLQPEPVPGESLQFRASKALLQSVVGRSFPLLITNIDSIPESKKEQLNDLVCPISLDVPSNPVLASDGFTVSGTLQQYGLG